jgi:hypothetical protein
MSKWGFRFAYCEKYELQGFRFIYYEIQGFRGLNWIKNVIVRFA